MDNQDNTPTNGSQSRAWLAKMLLDKSLSDEEAFGIVAHHPAILRIRKLTAETKLAASEAQAEALREALKPFQTFYDAVRDNLRKQPMPDWSVCEVTGASAEGELTYAHFDKLTALLSSEAPNG